MFWPFLEPEAPITGIDLISLSVDDWYRLFNEKENLRKPSVIKVRRLLHQIKSKTTSTIRLINHNNGAAKLLGSNWHTNTRHSCHTKIQTQTGG